MAVTTRSPMRSHTCMRRIAGDRGSNGACRQNRTHEILARTKFPVHRVPQERPSSCTGSIHHMGRRAGSDDGDVVRVTGGHPLLSALDRFLPGFWVLRQCFETTCPFSATNKTGKNTPRVLQRNADRRRQGFHRLRTPARRESPPACAARTQGRVLWVISSQPQSTPRCCPSGPVSSAPTTLLRAFCYRRWPRPHHSSSY